MTYNIPNGFLLESKMFGVVRRIDIDVSHDLIDTSSLGSTVRTQTRGQQHVAMTLELASDDAQAWIARIGELIDVDEVLGNEQTAFRIRGRMFVDGYTTVGRFQGQLGYELRLRNAGAMLVEKADTTVLVMRRTIQRIRAAAGLT